VLTYEDLPESLKANIDGVEFPPFIGGSAMVVVFKNGLNASVATGPGTYGGTSGLFEIAVGLDGEGIWTECPLTEASGVTGWLTSEDVITLLTTIGEYDDSRLRAKRRSEEYAELDAILTASSFGVLRMAGLGAEDDPYDYLESDEKAELMGLDLDSRNALETLRLLHKQASARLTEKFDTEDETAGRI